MIRPIRLAIQLVLIGAGAMGAAPLALAAGPLAQREEQEQTFSPLHDFLGIDPETGQFVGPKAEPGGQTETSLSPEADAPSSNATGERASEATEDLPREAEEAAEAIRRITERIDQGALDDLSSIVGERLSNDRLTALSRQFAWITAGLLLLYPLSMVLSELLGWWFQRHESGLSELDRQYRRSRLRRRLLLAGALTGLIIIAAVGSVNAYWWNQPELFTLFCVAAGLLGVAAATLAALVKQSAKHYSVMLMRQMHREQLEMRAELDELCRRMRQVTINQ